MASTKWRTVLLICAVTLYGKIKASQEIIARVSEGFGAVLDNCVSELGIDERVFKDLHNFWREDYELLNSDLGCVVICMVSELNLLDSDNKMHHGNVHAFAVKQGADDAMAKQLVSMLHDCESAQPPMEDPCVHALEIAKCFRANILKIVRSSRPLYNSSSNRTSDT